MQQTTHVQDRSLTAPPADAGPYVYDPPARYVGGPPSHTPRPAKQGYRWSWKLGGAIILMNSAANALHDWGGLTMLDTYVAVYLFISVFGYWVGERPQQSFRSWALKVIGIWLNAYVGFVTAPTSLRGLIPEPLAFGLPAFFVMLLFYWVPPLKPGGRRSPLWGRALLAAGLATLWGWLGPILVK